MANLLLDALPGHVDVDGRATGIRTDFRVGLLYEQLAWDMRVPPGERVAAGLALYFDEETLRWARDAGKATALHRAAVWFFACGADTDAQSEGDGYERLERLYDIDADGGLLYAAFHAQYAMDLQRIRLHWWSFRALMEGLSPEHAFCRRVAVRAARLCDAPDGAARGRLARRKARLRLERTEGTASEAMQAWAGAVFGGGHDLSILHENRAVDLAL